jgi:hypothetical protein
MKNKIKLFGIIIILIVAAAVVFYLIKSGVLNPIISETNDNDTVPNTLDKVLISRQELHVRPDNTTYTIPTRYQVGQNTLCYSDCKEFCSSQNLTTIYKAYSRSFGECMCKCLVE